MKVVQLTISIWMIILAVHITHSQNSFAALKQNMETRVKEIAQAMTKIYEEKGCSDEVLKCERKSYNQCQGTSQRQCFDDLQTPDDCGTDGTYLSKQSTISYPLNVDANKLSPEDKWLTCASAYLQESFVKEGDTTYGYQYIGTNTGAIRIYPSLRLVKNNSDQCIDYDTRTRPWYVTAASGSKNVIMFIDTSGSMSGIKFRIAKQAIKIVIDTLSNHDFFGIVTFGNNAQRVQQTLLRTTVENKEYLKGKLQNLQVTGQTNYKEAFEEGFRLLQSSLEDQFGRQCPDSENIFLFLTDGEPSTPQGYTDSESLINLIKDLKVTDKNNNGEHKIRLFTYGFGDEDNINVELLKDLSCQFSGINFLIDDSQGNSALVSAMKDYFTVISEGVQVQQPIWTEPYDDLYGFGRLIGVSMPIYYDSPTGIRTLLGVAAVDQSLSKFLEFGTEDEIVTKLIKDFPCSKSSLTDCNLQALRSQDNKCPNINNCDQRVGSEFACLPGNGLQASDIFLKPIEETKQRCCPSSVGIIIGAVIGGIALLAIIIGLIVFFWRRKERIKRQREQKQKRQKEEQEIRRNTIKKQNQQQQGSGAGNGYLKRGQNYFSIKQENQNKKKQLKNAYQSDTPAYTRPLR